MSDWIKPTERLPEPDQFVWVNDEDQPKGLKVRPARWDHINNIFAANYGWFEVDEVTHWKPMVRPEGPK